MSTSKLKVPEWMNQEFQKNCIKNSENLQENDILLENMEVDHTVPLGVNFMSILYDVKITFSVKNIEGHHTKSFVVKIILEIEEVLAFDFESHSFSRELDMYNKVLPDLQTLLDNAGIQKRLACKCVYSSMTPFRMVMENIKADGYEMADKYVGLDLEHCKMTLERLAFLHGASMHFHDMKREFPDKSLYYTPMISDTKFNRDTFSKKCVEKYMQILEILEAKSGYQNVVKYFLKNITNDTFGWICQQFKYIPQNQFNALLHGDAWIANVMFKYDENRKLLDLTLLDYQGSNYASVANDFHFFFFSSANNDVIENHLATLIDFYYESLVTVLKRLEYTKQIPTIEDFKNELKRASGCGMHMLFFMLPALRAKLPETTKTDNNGYTVDDMLRLGEDFFKSPEFQKTLFLGIDSLKSEGFFDH